MSAESASVETGTITTKIPARLDRLPWARFHWLVVAGLGTVWILDGLEVTIVGSVSSRLTQHGSGIAITTAQIGTAAAFYVGGACLGALFFGQLTDRFGRKKLFMITLAVYMIATAATGAAFSAWYFFIARFFTGAGIGGEYAAINSAIDELIPARVRGRVDLTINGSYWVGSILGSALSIILLDTAYLPKDIGWRLAFGVGLVLAVGVMLVRRHVPESPRWLFIHGREDEAERIVDAVEQGVVEETGEKLPEPESPMVVRQRESIPFREIARVGFRLYPKRSILALALFVGQAFIYNGITFNLGTLFTTFYKVSSSFVPVFVIVYAGANFLGPLLLGRLFDTVGRKPMITGTYLGSAAVGGLLAWLFMDGTLTAATPWALEAFIVVTFFLASAGASAAYLTSSEIFPMETRALAIAFFYAIGTAVGGISGPILFGNLIGSGNRHLVAAAFIIGDVVMAIGGVAEILWGVRAERQALEDIAKPLTVQEAEEGEDESGGMQQVLALRAHPDHRRALSLREEAEEVRARAAEHRARAHELRAEAAAERAEVEETLAAIADVHADALEQRAAAREGYATAATLATEDERAAALERARAAEERAAALEQRTRELGAESAEEERLHAELSQAARERARAREQNAAAEEARAERAAAEDERRAAVAGARAGLHRAWAEVHEERARLHELRAHGQQEPAREHERRAAAAEQRALAAEERVRQARHLVAVEEVRGEEEEAEQEAETQAEAAERERRRQEVEERIRARVVRRRERERSGLRRYRPGPGSGEAFFSPGMVGTAASTRGRRDEWELDREIEVIAHALDEHGETDRRELARLVGARYWGPGRFREALREAVVEQRIQRLSRTTYGPS